MSGSKLSALRPAPQETQHQDIEVLMNLATNWIAAKQAQLFGELLSDEKEEAIIKLLDLILDNPDGAFAKS